MQLKQIRAWQTADAKVHSTQVEALTHQFMLDLRGVMQTNNLGRMATISVTDVAQFIAGHTSELYPLMQKYKEKMKRAAVAVK